MRKANVVFAWMLTVGWIFSAASAAAAEPDYFFHFQDSTDGWQPVSTIAFEAPHFQSIPNAPGYLSMRNSRNTPTFGYWESAPIVVETTGTLYTAEYLVLSAVPDPARTPQLRVRATAENLQQSTFITAESRDDGAFSPDALGKVYTLAFVPASNGGQTRLEFELLSFDIGDDPQGDLKVDWVSVTRRPPEDLEPRTLVKTYTFDSTTEGWQEWVAPPFLEPVFTRSNGGLEIQGPGEVGAFGFWGSPGTDIVMDATQLYIATFEVESSLGAADRAMNPQFRLRLNEETLHASSVLAIESRGDGLRSPAAGEPQEYTIFLQPPAIADGKGLFASFDYLNFDPNDDQSASVRLNHLTIETVPYPW